MHGNKGDDKYSSDSASMGDDLQGGGSYGATLRYQELGSDRGDGEGDGGFTPSGVPEDGRNLISVS